MASSPSLCMVLRQPRQPPTHKTFVDLRHSVLLQLLFSLLISLCSFDNRQIFPGSRPRLCLYVFLDFFGDIPSDSLVDSACVPMRNLKLCSQKGRPILIVETGQFFERQQGSLLSKVSVAWLGHNVAKWFSMGPRCDKYCDSFWKRSEHESTISAWLFTIDVSSL